jgi:hypothetical protein
MNAYAAVVLASLVLSFIAELIAETLNLKALRDELPEEFSGVYDADLLHRSSESSSPWRSGLPGDSTAWMSLCAAGI